jgi:hypothetical protein
MTFNGFEGPPAPVELNLSQPISAFYSHVGLSDPDDLTQALPRP